MYSLNPDLEEIIFFLNKPYFANQLECLPCAFVCEMHIFERNHMFPFFQLDRRLRHHFPGAGRDQYYLKFTEVWVQESVDGKSSLYSNSRKVIICQPFALVFLRQLLIFAVESIVLV